MITSTTVRSVRVPTVDVAVGGRALAMSTPDVMSVALQQDTGALSTLTLVLQNWDTHAMRFTWSDDQRLVIGAALRVAVGHVDSPARFVLEGDISDLEPSFVVGEAPTLTVRGYDVRRRLSRGGPRFREFEETTDSAVARTVATEAGLAITVADTTVVHDTVTQYDVTDLEFLGELAERNDFELVTDERALLFRPAPTAPPPVVADLDLGRDVVSFTPRMQAVQGAGTTTVRGWDPDTKEPVVGTSGAGPSPVPGGAADVVVDVPVRTKAEADRLATARRNQQARRQVEADAECIGRPDLRAGVAVRIQRAGRRFSGVYTVSSATHEIGPSGYRTRLSMWRQP